MIPCFNEAETLSKTIEALQSFSSHDNAPFLLLIDDGSTDGSATIAKSMGIDHVIRHDKNKGLAEVFKTGLRFARDHGFDALVVFDADGQYPAFEIPRLLAKLESSEASLVIGNRDRLLDKNLNRTKKTLLTFGSWLLSKCFRSKPIDLVSGFRVFRLSDFAHFPAKATYTYTLETLIWSLLRGLKLETINIVTEKVDRPSRLMKSTFDYLWRQICDVFRWLPSALNTRLKIRHRTAKVNAKTRDALRKVASLFF